MASLDSEHEQEIRDDICGEIQRKVQAQLGQTCGKRDVDEVVEQLEDIRGVRVARWEHAEEQVDDRDFIDLTITRSTSSGKIFNILARNGFSPSALSGNWEGGTGDEEGRVVLQYKR